MQSSQWDTLAREVEQIYKEDEITALIAECQQHRVRKEFALADAVRDRLPAMDVQVYDTKEGVKWRRVDSLLQISTPRPLRRIPAPV